MLRLSLNALKKIEGVKYSRYYENIRLQLELIDYYKTLVNYSNRLPVSYKKKFEEIIFPDFDELEEAIDSSEYGINRQWIWEMTENDLPILIEFIKQKIDEQNQSS